MLDFRFIKHKTPEPDWDDLHERISKYNLEDIFELLKIQYGENKKLSRSNARLTWLTIIITIVLGIPNVITIFNKNYNHEILSEQIEQNRLFKEHTEKLDTILRNSFSFQEKLLNLKVADEKSKSDN